MERGVVSDSRAGTGVDARPCTTIVEIQLSSEGSSKSIKLPRKPRVLIAPKAMPATIQIPPAIHAFQLRFFHKKKQIVKPASGGVHTARITSPRPATANNAMLW